MWTTRIRTYNNVIFTRSFIKLLRQVTFDPFARSRQCKVLVAVLLNLGLPLLFSAHLWNQRKVFTAFDNFQAQIRLSAL